MIDRTIDERRSGRHAPTHAAPRRPGTRVQRRDHSGFQSISSRAASSATKYESRIVKPAQMGLAVPDGDEAAVLRHVQPLVAVRRPAVGQIMPVGQRVEPRAGAGEQPEGAIDVHPGSVSMGERNQRRERIEHAEIEIARVERDNRGPVTLRGRPRASAARASVAHHRQHVQLARTDTQVAQRAVDRHVVHLGDEHADWRSDPASPCSADVPPALHEQE